MAKQKPGVYDRVLECAKEEFLSKGFLDASLRTIAQAAETSTGSIYTRFGDKEGLFRAIAEPVVDQFKAITGDVSPIHIDADYAKDRGFPGRVVYGMLGASFFSTLAGVYLPGEHCLLHGVECKFAKPIFIGDTLTVKGTVERVSEIGSEAEIKAVITNQDGKRVTRGIIKAGLAK